MYNFNIPTHIKEAILYINIIYYTIFIIFIFIYIYIPSAGINIK